MDTDTGLWLYILFFVLMLFLTAFAAAAETVLTSISRMRAVALLEEGASKGRAFNLFMNEPGTLLSAIILLNTFAIVLAATLAALFVEHRFGTNLAAIGGVIVSFLLILLFQVVPKTLAAQDPERIAGWFSGPVRLLGIILAPLTFIVRALSHSLTKASGGQEPRDTPLVTEEELRRLVNVGEEEGIIEEGEREMISGIFDLEETTVRTLMVPRIDVTGIPVDASLPEILKIIVEQGYSRIPVYEGGIDNIIGILYAKDLFQYILPLAREQETRPPGRQIQVPPLPDIVRGAYFIPETKKVDDLLRELQHTKVHIAIVVDEYGGTAGLVTIEDLLEEIVGEIQDEYDREEVLIERINPDILNVDGRVSLDDVNEELDITLNAAEYDTIGGFVLERVGQVPSAGTIVDVTDQNGQRLQIKVLETGSQRIKRLSIHKLPPLPETGEEMSDHPESPRSESKIEEQNES